LVGELPHLANIDVHNDPRFEIIGVEHIDNLRDNGKPAIYFSAHLANWEAACVAGAQRGLKVTKIYRALNNPYLKKLWHKLMLGADKELLNKGPESGRRIIQLLSKGEHISMLLDQKLNRGLPIPFFGRESMTPPAGARMAMRFNCPMIPSRVERLGGFKFRITYYPPLEISNTGDLTYDLYETLCRMNNMIESWVRARPDQWLWIYRRWPKDGDIIKPIDLKKK
jgi:KDO2-lipid IV(A) lauroyltransferase